MVKKGLCFSGLVLWFLVLTQAGTMTFAPAGHCEQLVPPLQAAQNGLQYVMDLVSTGKLEKSWAENFAGATVTTRNIKGFAEYVVHISRSSGSPSSAMVFFNFSGGFSGTTLEQKSQGSF